MASEHNPPEGERVELNGEGWRALSDCRMQYMAQSVLTPMPLGTHDAGKIGPILPVEQAFDVLVWNERHQIQMGREMPAGWLLTCWIPAEVLRRMYPKDRTNG